MAAAGATNMLGEDGEIWMEIGDNKSGATNMVVKLIANALYNIIFLRMEVSRHPGTMINDVCDPVIVNEFYNVEADKLAETFEEFTGLRVRL